MTEEDIKRTAGRALWQQARERLGDPSPAPDPLALAAYLEGRLTPAETEAFEAQLNGSAAGLDLLLAARDALDGPVAAVSPRALERAKALRAATARTTATGPLQTIAHWFDFGRRTPMRSLALAGTAAVYMTLCIVTFDLGRQGAVESLMVSEATTGLDYALSLDDVL